MVARHADANLRMAASATCCSLILRPGFWTRPSADYDAVCQRIRCGSSARPRSPLMTALTSLTAFSFGKRAADEADVGE